MTIDVICSWCNKFLHSKTIGDDIDTKLRISHSICESCKEQVIREYKRILKLNGIRKKRRI